MSRKISNYSKLSEGYQDNTKNYSKLSEGYENTKKQNTKNDSVENWDVQLPTGTVLPLLVTDYLISLQTKSVIGYILDIPIDFFKFLVGVCEDGDIALIGFEKIKDLDKNLKSLFSELKKYRIRNMKSYLKLIKTSMSKFYADSMKQLLKNIEQAAIDSIEKSVTNNIKSSDEITKIVDNSTLIKDFKNGVAGLKAGIQGFGKLLLKSPDLVFSGISLSLDIADYAGATVGSVNYSSMLTNEGLFALKNMYQNEFEDNLTKSEIDKNLIIGPLTRDGVNYFELLLAKKIFFTNGDRFIIEINKDITSFNNGNKIQYLVDAYNPDNNIFTNNCLKYKVKEYLTNMNIKDCQDLYAQINIDYRNLCQNNKGFITTDGICSYTESNCVAGIAFDTNNLINFYSEWKDGKCKIADPTMMQTCNKIGLEYDKNITITGSDEDCKLTNTCKTLSGFCKIDSDYCFKYKAGYEPNPNISNKGDCNVALGQQIAEMLIGTVILRELMDAEAKALEPLNDYIMRNSGDILNTMVNIASPVLNQYMDTDVKFQNLPDAVLNWRNSIPEIAPGNLCKPKEPDNFNYKYVKNENGLICQKILDCKKNYYGNDSDDTYFNNCVSNLYGKNCNDNNLICQKTLECKKKYNNDKDLTKCISNLYGKNCDDNLICQKSLECKKGYNNVVNFTECVHNSYGKNCDVNSDYSISLYDKNGKCVKTNNCMTGYTYDSNLNKCKYTKSGQDCVPGINRPIACLKCEKPTKGDIISGIKQVYDDEGYCTVLKTGTDGGYTCIDSSNVLRYDNGKPYCAKPVSIDNLGAAIGTNPYDKPLFDSSNLGAGMFNAPIVANSNACSIM